MEVRTLPNAVDIEREVLGAMLIDMDAIMCVVEILKPEDFYLESHKVVCKAIYSLYEKGKPVDLILVTEEVKNMGKLEKIGGASFIADLASGVVSSANVEKHAEIIREKAVLRDLIKASNQIIEMAYKATGSTEDLLDEAEQKIFAIREYRRKGEVRHIKDYLEVIFKIIDKRSSDRKSITGVPSGFTVLDHYYTSGFQPSDLVIIAGRPSTGKTALALNIATYMAKQDIPVAFFSLEMHWESLLFRVISTEANIPSTRLRKGELDQDDWDRLGAAIGYLNSTPFWVDSTPAMNIYELRAKARRMKKEHDVQAIFIDYLQLIKGPRAENRQQEVAAVSRALKGIAMELNVPIIALSQLSRAPSTRGKKDEEAEPRLSDLRESGQIEQDADLVIFLHRKKKEDVSEKVIPIKVIVAKHRNGPTGDFELMFQKDITKFREEGTPLTEEVL